LSARQTELLELLDQNGATLFALLFIRLSGAKDQGGIDCWYAYARRTAINLAFDWRRRRATRRSCSLDGLGERASDDSAPLSRLIQSEEIERVLAAIGRLRGTSREVFVIIKFVL